MEKQITQNISYHFDSRKIQKITAVVEEICVGTWSLICEREEIIELEFLVVFAITRFNDYGVLIDLGESLDKGQVH